MIDTRHTIVNNRIYELMPWYVTGSLSADEKAEVDIYLEKHPELFQKIEFLEQVQNATADKVDIPVPDLTSVMRKIDAIEQAEKKSFMCRMREYINSFFYPTAAWSAVSVLLALTAVLLWLPDQAGRHDAFQTLSSDNNIVPMTITVTTSATKPGAMLIEQIHQLLPNAEIRIETGNQLVITTANAVESEKSLELLEHLQSHPVVQSAVLTPIP